MALAEDAARIRLSCEGPKDAPTYLPTYQQTSAVPPPVILAP